jgi:hypothetical protein
MALPVIWGYLALSGVLCRSSVGSYGGVVRGALEFRDALPSPISLLIPSAVHPKAEFGENVMK